jgi:hypothetical protein
MCEIRLQLSTAEGGKVVVNLWESGTTQASAPQHGKPVHHGSGVTSL